MNKTIWKYVEHLWRYTGHTWKHTEHIWRYSWWCTRRYSAHMKLHIYTVIFKALTSTAKQVCLFLGSCMCSEVLLFVCGPLNEKQTTLKSVSRIHTNCVCPARKTSSSDTRTAPCASALYLTAMLFISSAETAQHHNPASCVCETRLNDAVP